MPLSSLESFSVKDTSATGSPFCFITRTSMAQASEGPRDLLRLCAGLARSGFGEGVAGFGFPQLPSLFGNLPPGHCAVAAHSGMDMSAVKNNRDKHVFPLSRYA